MAKRGLAPSGREAKSTAAGMDLGRVGFLLQSLLSADTRLVLILAL